MANCALILKISPAMLAFAANSILCRLALQGGHIDPLFIQQPQAGQWCTRPVTFLVLSRKNYIIAVASAERILPHGVRSALLCRLYPSRYRGRCAVTFGAVQFAMVIHGLFKGESLSVMRACGLVIALAGIAALLLPGRRHRRFTVHL
jgi:hypothetical protein